MRYWLQYHNYDKLGYLPGGYDAEWDDLSSLDPMEYKSTGITTGKKLVLDTIGDVVFLVLGYGEKNKKYLLWYWNIIEDVTEQDEGQFLADGAGSMFTPFQVLSGPEFDQFKKSNANFSLGFQEITKLPFLRRIVELARTHAYFDRMDSYTEALRAIPQEVQHLDGLFEGSVRIVAINAYERNAEARRKCLEHFGAKCVVCELDFASVYGAIAKGIIHVHHKVPLAEIGEEYEVDPIKDLCPVCPNCHAVIHARTPAYSIDEVRLMLKK